MTQPTNTTHSFTTRLEALAFAMLLALALSSCAQRIANPCLDCGVVKSINKQAKNSSTSAAGVLVGAIVGGLVGNQIGGGEEDDNGKSAAVGVVGGAIAGMALAQKAAEKNPSYTVVVSMDDGNTRNIKVQTPPKIKVGDAVRITNNEIESL